MEKKIEHELPDKLELFHHGSHFEITRKWFRLRIVLVTAFAMFWDGFLINMFSKASARGEPIPIFALIHIAVGIALTYYVVAGWLNRTHIFVNHGKIAVRHRPIPWFGNKELEASNLKQLHVRKKISRNRNGTSIITYQIHAETHYSQNIRLVSGLETSEQALYIERKIEKYLRIVDVPVKGEVEK